MFFGNEMQHARQAHETVEAFGFKELQDKTISSQVGLNQTCHTHTKTIMSHVLCPTPEDDSSARAIVPDPDLLDADSADPGDFGDSFCAPGGLVTPEGSTASPEPPRSSGIVVELPESTLLRPRSLYEPFEPGVPVVPEEQACIRLRAAALKAGQNPHDFIEFLLDDFAVYCTAAYFNEEMKSLHHVDTKTVYGTFYMNGRLSVGDVAFYVKRVPIQAVPIGNYSTLSKHTVRGKIWLLSKLNCNRNIYYKLQTPAHEYRRFYTPFLWVADLAKHFVDFLQTMANNNRKVTIHHFQTTFSTWMTKVHHKAPVFGAWRNQHPSQDFRTSIAANLGFLHKEAVGLLGYEGAFWHTIWAEIWNYSHYESVGSKVENPPTVVTQYIYDCFEHLPFGDRLKAVPLGEESEMLRNKLIRSRHLELPAPIHQTNKDLPTTKALHIGDIKPGDTISTQRDSEDSGSSWRRDVSKGFDDVDRWLALVQRVLVDKSGQRTFDVIWYYRAVDTLCGLMKYPWNNELFLSDHCSCRETSKISEDEVQGVHEVEFGGTSATKAEFFCRQAYMHIEKKWVTLQSSHLHCPHTKPARADECDYKRGETLLVLLYKESARSEPCEFVAYIPVRTKKLLRFRLLKRRRQVDPEANARPNELVYSEQFVEVRKHRVQGPCFVRFFGPREVVPTPYDRNGVGAHFYITHRENWGADGALKYLPLQPGNFPKSLRQSYDPSQEMAKLRGLDLFCGGGNFGRGLEEGGAIEMRWANDYDEKAIHTYMANAAPETVNPFLGSIDNLHRLVMEGRFAKNVPSIGEVDFISGGSPCPGFSNLTNDKTTVQQRKNQSLVAAFGSSVDVYRPKYGLLENVTSIVQKTGGRDQDVFSQLICAIVGLGYQTQFYFLDASSCGSPQLRSRVFLAFAAPEYKLPERPQPTHANPPYINAKSLGNLPNGQSMASRMVPLATPFDFVPAQEAAGDLPSIYDGKPDICVSFPDHRTSIGVTQQLRTRLDCIPLFPRGMNFAKAWYGLDMQTPGSGVLTPAEYEFFATPQKRASRNEASVYRDMRTRIGSCAYGRQMPNKLIETIVTCVCVCDAKTGRVIHWCEPRPMTIMEARRAQGFRDDEVLLGLPNAQYRIVGNSVAREVAVTLGTAFREAWAASLQEQRERRVATNQPAEDEEHREPPVMLATPSTSQESTPQPLTKAGSKRPRNQLIVEIISRKAVKTRRMRRSDSPGSSTASPRKKIGVGRPSPLLHSETIVTDDDDDDDDDDE